MALKETAHRPLVTERYPAFAPRIEYWHVDDVDCCPAEQALDAIDALVDELLGRARRARSLDRTRPRTRLRRRELDNGLNDTAVVAIVTKVMGGEEVDSAGSSGTR